MFSTTAGGCWRARGAWSGVAAVVLIGVLAGLSILVGPPWLSPAGAARAAGSPEMSAVVWQLRVPRAVLAVVAGASLGVVGLLLQDLLRNPLAGPDLLGVAPGAVVAMASVAVTGVGGGFVVGPLVSLVGALAGAVVVLVFAAGQRDPVRFAVVGAAVSAGLTAVAIAVISLGNSVSTGLLYTYMLGSLAGRTWSSVAPTLVAAGLLAAVAVPVSRAVEVLRSGGERLASSVGIRPRRLMVGVVVLAAVVTAGVVSCCGPVPFLALLAPFLARRLTDRRILSRRGSGGGTVRLLGPTALLGALLLLAADTVGRLIAFPQELPVGVPIAVLGGPVLLGLLRTVQGQTGVPAGHATEQDALSTTTAA